MVILQVALPVPKRQVFDYYTDAQAPEKGVRVRVPFANRFLTGVVVGQAQSSSFADKLKPIQKVLDSSPLFSPALLELCHWLSRYYQHPLGEVLHVALPALLRKEESAAGKTIAYLRATERGAIIDLAALARAVKQKELMALLQQGAVSLVQVRAGFSMQVVKALKDKQLAEITQVLPKPDLGWQQRMQPSDKPKANLEQALAISRIIESTDRYQTFLLEGVTGSGKTEVYLQSIEGILRQGKQVLILVPEIGLTPQTVHRFKHRFGLPVGVLHSGLSDNERLHVWQQGRAGALPIVIGTRSAIFTPLANPGMLIVDEEHDASYKQQDGLRYSARDLAVMRARAERIPLILGSATPCLESLNNALAGKYQHLQLSERAGAALHAKQNLMDVRNQPMQHGLAAGMITRIGQHLDAGGQVMLFVNRRGYAPALVCHRCGHVEVCLRCDKPYTLHKQLHKLQCHHCASAKPVVKHCAQCGSLDMQAVGVGTERLEAGLQQLFPASSCVRIDSDSTRGNKRLGEMLEQVNQLKHQLLIGTQILSKGHHFVNVTLVVLLDVDAALFSADYRAAEHLAQLITQLAGRAGRATKAGEMWLQTHHPGHPLLQDLINNGYAHFARHALLERQQAYLPPFSYQALFRAEANAPRLAQQFLSEVAGLFAHQGVALIGPLPGLMEKRQGRYRLQLLLQSCNRKKLQQVLAGQVNKVENLPAARKVRWSLDVDPQDFV